MGPYNTEIEQDGDRQEKAERFSHVARRKGWVCLCGLTVSRDELDEYFKKGLCGGCLHRFK